MSARPNRNGVSAKENPARKNRGRGNRVKDAQIALAGGRTPLGNPPTGNGSNGLKWNSVWRELARDLHWLDASHRRYVKEAVNVLVQQAEIAEFFKQRKAQMVKDGKSEAEAYLTDDGFKRHPLAIHQIAVGDAVRKVLTSLGASPASQVKLAAEAHAVVSEQGSVTDYFEGK